LAAAAIPATQSRPLPSAFKYGPRVRCQRDRGSRSQRPGSVGTAHVTRCGRDRRSVQALATLLGRCDRFPRPARLAFRLQSVGSRELLGKTCRHTPPGSSRRNHALYVALSQRCCDRVLSWPPSFSWQVAAHRRLRGRPALRIGRRFSRYFVMAWSLREPRSSQHPRFALARYRPRYEINC